VVSGAPELLGAVLDLAAKVMDRLPSVELERKPRMADYARILAAVDAELGTSALERYAQQAADLAAEGLSGDSFASQIQAVIVDGFEGTAAELLAKVKPGDPEWKAPKDWPASPRAVTGKLRRLAPAFRKTGWTVDDLGRGGHGKQIRWKISPPPQTEIAGDDARACPQRPHDENEAGDAGNGGQDSGPSPADRQEENRARCTISGEPLDPVLVAEGYATHGEEAGILKEYAGAGAAANLPGAVA
jgi:hypothetical protein